MRTHADQGAAGHLAAGPLADAGADRRVAVAPGDEVKLGQELCVLEAMKMENVLRAERDGVVAEVRMEPGIRWPPTRCC